MKQLAPEGQQLSPAHRPLFQEDLLSREMPPDLHQQQKKLQILQSPSGASARAAESWLKFNLEAL